MSELAAVALRETVAEVATADRQGRWIQDRWTVPTGDGLVSGCVLAHRAALDGGRVVTASGLGWLPVRGDMLFRDGTCITGREIDPQDWAGVYRRAPGLTTWELWARARLGLTRREFEAVSDVEIATLGEIAMLVEQVIAEERPELVAARECVERQRANGWA